MKYIKNWTRTYFQFCFDNKIYLILVLILLACIAWLWYRVFLSLFFFDRIPISYADLFITMVSPPVGWSPYGMVVIPLMVIFLILLESNDFKINYLIREKTLEAVWLRQVFWAILTAFFVSLSLTFMTAIVGYLCTDVPINFDDRQSMFAFYSDGLTAANPSLLSVATMFFLYCFSIASFMGILFSLLRWLLSSLWLPLVVILLIGFIDYSPSGVSLVYTLATIGYSYWAGTASSNLGILLGASLVLGIVGYFLLPKRELKHAK